MALKLKQMTITLEHEGGAAFLSRYRNYRWVGKSQRTRYNDAGDPIVQDGISVQFAEGVAVVEDPEVISLMINDSKTFGTDFCIDPADRTGYWAKFNKEYPKEVLQKHFPLGVPSALLPEIAANISAEISAAAAGSKLQRGVVHVAKGKLPIKDGGRDRFTEEQETALAAIGTE